MRNDSVDLDLDVSVEVGESAVVRETKNLSAERFRSARQNCRRALPRYEKKDQPPLRAPFHFVRFAARHCQTPVGCRASILTEGQGSVKQRPRPGPSGSTAASLSSRRFDPYSRRPGGCAKALVVDHHPSQIGTQCQRRREVNGVERSQVCRLQASGVIEDLGGHAQDVASGE